MTQMPVVLSFCCVDHTLQRSSLGLVMVLRIDHLMKDTVMDMVIRFLYFERQSCVSFYPIPNFLNGVSTKLFDEANLFIRRYVVEIG